MPFEDAVNYCPGGMGKFCIFVKSSFSTCLKACYLIFEVAFRPRGSAFLS